MRFLNSIKITLLAISLMRCGSLLSELERIRKKYESLNAVSSVPIIGAVGPLYSTAPSWLDYVRNDAATPLTASGAVCTGTEGGHYGSCLHGGEMLSVQVTNRDSCGDLAAKDELDALQWTCLQKNGAVFMVSTGLKLEKNLSDLINFSSGTWRANSVTVSANAGAAKSNAAIWWSNPIVVNAAPGSLSAAGTIYAFNSDPAGNFILNANRLAFVGKPGLSLHGAGTYIQATAKRFLWIEGEFKLFTDSDLAVNLDTVFFSMLRNLAVQGTGGGTPTFGKAMALPNSMQNFVLSLRANSFGDSAISLNNSPYNVFHRLMRSNGYQKLASMSGGGASINNVYLDFIATNVAYGAIYFDPGNSGSYLQNGLSLQMTSSIGLDIEGRSTVLGVVGAVMTQPGSPSLQLQYNTSQQSTVADSAFAHNNGPGLAAYFDNTYNFITGEILVGNNVTDCIGNASRGISNACTVDGASNFTLTTGVSLATSFVGRLYQNDATNASAGTVGLSTGAPTDWLYFDNRYRTWGKDAGDLGTSGNSGFCSGVCRLWDYSLKATDTVFRERLAIPLPGDTLVHRWQETTQIACEKIKGAVWQDQVCDRPGYLTAGACTGAGGTWSTGLCSTRFLRHAHELFFTGRGNNNGLCESGEACLYTPNIGAYQGHGNLVYVGRVSGANASDIQNVELYRYEANGF